LTELKVTDPQLIAAVPAVKFNIPELCVKVPVVIVKFPPTIIVALGAVNAPELIEKAFPIVIGL